MRIAKFLFIPLFLSLQLPAIRADVQVQQKSQVKFSGFMGKMLGMFGGKAAKEGLVTTEAVVGNRKLSRTQDQGQIIDLDQEKVYQIDWKRKRYTVTTFDQMREQMKKAEEQMKSMSQEPKENEAQKGSASEEDQYEVDVDTKETGQTKQINGFDTREVVMTITTRKKGQTLEEGGGMVMTTHLWLTDDIPGMDEIQEFNRRYAEKISSPFIGSSPQQFAAFSAMYPAMQQAMAKYQSEEVDTSGAPVLTTMTIENVTGKEQMQSEKQQEEEPKSLGGLFGGLSKKFGKKKSEQDENQQPGRSTVMTMTNEILSASSTVPAGEVAIPAGFKEK